MTAAPTRLPVEADGPGRWITGLYGLRVTLSELDFLGERWLVIEVPVEDPGAIATLHVLGGLVLDDGGRPILRQVLPAAGDAVMVDHVIAYLAAAALPGGRAHGDGPKDLFNYAL